MVSNKISYLGVIFIVSINLVCGCSTVRMNVKAQRNPEINFSEYKKFTFVDISAVKKAKGRFIYKEYLSELTEKKLESLGFVRNDENADFAVWIAHAVSPVSGYYKYSPMQKLELIPTGESDNYPIYTVYDYSVPKHCSPKKDNPKEYICMNESDGYLKIIGVILFDVRNIPKSVRPQKIFDLFSSFQKSKQPGTKLSEKERLQIFESIIGLLNDKGAFTKDKDFDVKLAWLGFAGYVDGRYELKERAVPFLVDVIFNSYPTEHMSKFIDVSLRRQLDWTD
jgi:hypothetical protein